MTLIPILWVDDETNEIKQVDTRLYWNFDCSLIKIIRDAMDEFREQPSFPLSLLGDDIEEATKIWTQHCDTIIECCDEWLACVDDFMYDGSLVLDLIFAELRVIFPGLWT